MSDERRATGGAGGPAGAATAVSARDLGRGGALLDRVVGFGRYLRRVGLPVTLGQVMDLVGAV